MSLEHLFAILGGTSLAIATLFLSSIKVLREANQDLRDSLNDSDREKEKMKQELEMVRTDLAALTRVVTNEAYITALAERLGRQFVDVGKKLDIHNNAAAKHWEVEEQKWNEILNALLNGGNQ
jgi:FtsZ-binding cell division protein ZapB